MCGNLTFQPLTYFPIFHPPLHFLGTQTIPARSSVTRCLQVMMHLRRRRLHFLGIVARAWMQKWLDSASLTALNLEKCCPEAVEFVDVRPENSDFQPKDFTFQASLHLQVFGRTVQATYALILG